MEAKFRDILVYVEAYDEACLRQVDRLAQSQGAAITLCEVVSMPHKAPEKGHIVDRITRLRRTRAQQRLRQASAFLSDHLVDVHVLEGVHFIAITEHVMRQGFDLVVYISESPGGPGGKGLTATGMHLVRKCPCAIWALKAGPVSRNTDVLLAMDREVSDQTTRAEAFALGMTEVAITTAVAQQGKLRVLHAWRPYGYDLMGHAELGLGDSEWDEYLEQQRSETRDWFLRMTRRIRSTAPEDLKIDFELAESDPLPTIKLALESSSTGTLVIGNVGISANAGVLIGTTAESILAAVEANVLALKPSGFVSPLAV